MLSLVTIKVKYGDEMTEIGVATRLDVLNDHVASIATGENIELRVARLKELERLINHLIEKGFMTFVPLKNTEKEHNVRIKGVNEQVWVTIQPELKIGPREHNGPVVSSYSCPNGEYLIEDAVKMACRKNNVAIPEFMLHQQTVNREQHMLAPKPNNSWFPGFNRYMLAAAGMAVLAVTVEVTRSYWENPRLKS